MSKSVPATQLSGRAGRIEGVRNGAAAGLVGGSATARILSLDVFRGLTIVLMILVNSQGDGADPYPVLEHAEWFGLTLADLVFPSFLFAMGNALAFVLARPMGQRDFLLKVGRRSVLLFLLGFLISWYPFVYSDDAGILFASPLSQARIMGVLQRTALCYALAALCARYCPPRRVFWVCAALLVSYWALLVFGAPTGQAFSRVGNLGSRIDLAVLGAAHIYPYADGFEPEGLLGTLPACVNVLAGYLAGRVLQRTEASARASGRTAGCGVALVIAALVWSVWFPLSKNLWTGSYVLMTVGIDLVLLSVLVMLYDVFKLSAGAQFFRVFGMNPLVLYVFSELLLPSFALMAPIMGTDPYEWLAIEVFQRLAPGPPGALLSACFCISLCWAVGAVMFRRRIFVRI